MTIQHHIKLGPEHLEGNSGLGRYVFLPGDRSRAKLIAESFSSPTVVDNPRGYTAHLGTIDGEDRPIDVLSISSGMGCASVEIILYELIAAGCRRVVRVGSCGTLNAAVSPGDVVIASGAVRDEGTTVHYAPKEFPAVAHPKAVAALEAGAVQVGLADQAFTGICHSKDSLYAREFGQGPAGVANREYQDWIGRAGCIASEMEAAALFILASAYSTPSPVSGRGSSDEVQAGCVLAVFGGDDSEMKFDEDLARLGQERAIKVALAGVRAWAGFDRSSS